MTAEFVKAARTRLGERLGGARLNHKPEIWFATCPEEMKGEFGIFITVGLWLSPVLALTMLRISGDPFFGFLWLSTLLLVFLVRSRQRFFMQYFAPSKLTHIVSRHR